MKKIYLTLLLLVAIKISSAQENRDPEMDDSCPRSRTQKNKQSSNGEATQKKAASVVIFCQVKDNEDLIRMIEKQRVENGETNQPAQERSGKREFKRRRDE